MEKELNIRSMVLTALMTALVYIATMIVRIPTPGGMIHMGDFTIFISVLILGTKRAVFASGVGMFLVNVLGGLMHWAPFTLVIKGSMALIVGLIIDKKGISRKTCFIGFTLASIFMVIGYFLAGIIVANFFTGSAIGFTESAVFAARDILPNILQVTVAVAIATPMVSVIENIKRRTNIIS